jgi:non-specific serine/threonine protein kinase
VAVARAAGHARELGYSLTLLGRVTDELGDPVAGRRLVTEARRLLRRVGDRDALSVNLTWSGVFAMSRGEPAAARELLDEALRLALEMGFPLQIMTTQIVLGDLARVEDDVAGARARYAEALGTARDCGVRSHRWPVTHALRRLGGVSATAGDSLRAARLFGAAALLDAGWTALDYQHDRSNEEAQAAALAARDDPALAAAHVEGAAMTLDEAVAYALGDAAATPMAPRGDSAGGG